MDALERKKLRDEQQARANQLASTFPGLRSLPFINQYDDLALVSEVIALTNQDDFNWAVSFDPDFVAELMYYGFLTMCESLGKKRYILMPKLHNERSVLDLKDLHIARTTRKHGKGFSISMDLDFEAVCEGIIRQHGESWFYKPLVDAFIAMHRKGPSGNFDGKVFMHSFELWSNETNELVAGEVGYRFNGCYTSLSGFSKMDSAGSVQMAATGSFLIESGLTLWDLGMTLDYKSSMGASVQPRREFLRKLAQSRSVQCTEFLTLPKTPANEIIQRFTQNRVQKEKERERMRARIAQQVKAARNSSARADSGIKSEQTFVSKKEKKRAEKMDRRKAYLEKKQQQTVDNEDHIMSEAEQPPKPPPTDNST